MAKRSKSSKAGMTPKGREIVRSLEELLAVMRSGAPLESKFRVRVVTTKSRR